MSNPRYTITAALPYANGPVHIGHLAGCYLPADVYARYLRARGHAVFFVCGSDEHGVPITIRAKKEGVSYQQVVDKYHQLMHEAFAAFGISFNHYGRTSSATHHRFSSDFFKKLNDAGVFSQETTQQYFDPEAAQFLADRYITGTCPRCANPAAYGDQCEKCGSTLNATELINPKSALSGATPQLKQTTNWFLPLDRLQTDFVQHYIDSKAGSWKNHVLGQCQSWLAEGLKPRAMTRDLDWGVKVPVEGADGKVLYVWFDAPLGYVSATQEALPDTWQKWWVKQDGPEQRLIHFIGKDNIVFHCIIFPAMLHAFNSLGGLQYLIAEAVPANEFLNLEGEKISTSRNHAVWLHQYMADLPGRTDELRYYLTSIMPENADSDFTWKGYQLAVNSELVAIAGNFVNRVAVLLHKFYGGAIPAAGTPVPQDEALFAGLQQAISTIESHVEAFRFRDAQAELINLYRAGNKYFAETEPWHLVKTSPEQTATILATAANYCVSLGILSSPFLPQASAGIQHLFAVAADQYTWAQAGHTRLLPPGHQIAGAFHLYKNVEDEDINTQLQRLQQQKTENDRAANTEANETKAKPQIGFDDFARLDIRIGTIVEAVKVPKADKLLHLTVQVGAEARSIVSGIAQHFSPETLPGKQVLVLANLSPRKMKGIESQGMILLAEDEQGKLVFVSPETAVNSGAVVS